MDLGDITLLLLLLLIMVKVEHCYGIIPLRLKNQELQVLLALHVQGNYWAFPKGHGESNEEPQACAKRELFEETSLRVKFFLAMPPLKEDYQFQRRGESVHKFVTYFPASVSGKIVLQQSGEIIEANWFSLERASQMITFEQSRILLDQLLDKIDDLRMKIRKS